MKNFLKIVFIICPMYTFCQELFYLGEKHVSGTVIVYAGPKNSDINLQAFSFYIEDTCSIMLSRGMDIYFTRNSSILIDHHTFYSVFKNSLGSNSLKQKSYLEKKTVLLEKRKGFRKELSKLQIEDYFDVYLIASSFFQDSFWAPNCFRRKISKNEFVKVYVY